MADELSHHASRHRRHRRSRRIDLAKPASLAVFALLVTLAPLAFGAVDRLVQIALTALLGVGMLIAPPRIIALPAWLSRLIAALIAMLVVKELAPAGWFGAAQWRSTLEQAYGLALPWTHHPEPGRALDGWLAGAVALGWFAWVRTLASERAERTRLAWLMLSGAVLVALVSFATAGGESKMIHGLRFTPGWSGFGPFPNRNHSACFFAMAALLGAGCLARSGERRHFGQLCAAALAIGVLLLALLRTQSRGGVIALGAGLALFFGVVLLKLRSRQALAVAVASALLVGGLGLLAGGRTLKRFAGTGLPADDSAAARVEVWRDAAAMWRDAPLLGHGLGAFEPAFPMYQQTEMEEVRVKHPESSWMQWLVELGLVPVLLGSVAVLAFSLPNFGALFERRSSFFIRAAAFGAVATLVAHGVFDVPAHRWGTMAFGLAALALACPAAVESRSAPRLAAAVPLGVAAFWILPLCFDKPAWSTFQLERVLARQPIPPGLPLGEIEASLRGFPLNAQLHFARGERLLRMGAPPSHWQNDFRIATRLVPNSWELCVRCARLCRPVHPSLALHYWQLAIERATRQRADVFGRALADTKTIPGAAGVWAGYAEAHPDLALIFAETLPAEAGRRYFDLWWQSRGSLPGRVSDAEAAAFVRVAQAWSTPEQLDAWVRRHPERAGTDFRGWAAILLAWGRPEQAWEIVRRQLPEPAYPATLPRLKREDLSFLWLHNPEDIVNARSYAHLLEHLGEHEESGRVIRAVAERPDAPKWFVEKAAHQLAKGRDYVKALELVLRPPGPRPGN